MKEMHFLGHVINEQGVKCDPAKLEVIQEWPRPKTTTEIRSFYGLASYYRRFIPFFAEISAPLARQMGGDAVYEWNEETEKSFIQIKEALCKPPLLALPDNTNDFVLDTDASNNAIGCVLSIIRDGEEHVVAYGSRALSKAECNYCTTKKELLAVVHFLHKYRHYLRGRPITVRTDHASLTWLIKFKEPEGMMARRVDAAE